MPDKPTPEEKIAYAALRGGPRCPGCNGSDFRQEKVTTSFIPLEWSPDEPDVIYANSSREEIIDCSYTEIFCNNCALPIPDESILEHYEWRWL